MAAIVSAEVCAFWGLLGIIFIHYSVLVCVCFSLSQAREHSTAMFIYLWHLHHCIRLLYWRWHILHNYIFPVSETNTNRTWTHQIRRKLLVSLPLSFRCGCVVECWKSFRVPTSVTYSVVVVRMRGRVWMRCGRTRCVWRWSGWMNSASITLTRPVTTRQVNLLADVFATVNIFVIVVPWGWWFGNRKSVQPLANLFQEFPKVWGHS